jgi:hypothetical protein
MLPVGTTRPALPCRTANVLVEGDATMTDNDPTRATTTAGDPAPWPRLEPDTAPPAEDPGYLTETGQAADEDGSVVPIIGGLPAVEGSAWDIGAPVEDRGAGLAKEQGSADQADR